MDATANHPPRHFAYEGFPTIFFAGMKNKVTKTLFYNFEPSSVRAGKIQAVQNGRILFGLLEAKRPNQADDLGRGTRRYYIR